MSICCPVETGIHGFSSAWVLSIPLTDFTFQKVYTSSCKSKDKTRKVFNCLWIGRARAFVCSNDFKICTWVWQACECRDPRSQEASDLQEPDSRAIVNYLLWVLGTELQSCKSSVCFKPPSQHTLSLCLCLSVFLPGRVAFQKEALLNVGKSQAVWCPVLSKFAENSDKC